VPVAILSSSTFDATTMDPLTVRLASAGVRLRGNGTPLSSLDDVNGDGLPDLVVHVSTEALQLTATDTTATLEATSYPLGALSRPFGGRPVRGADTVRVVP
jgi:hypothetical protein